MTHPHLVPYGTYVSCVTFPGVVSRRVITLLLPSSVTLPVCRRDQEMSVGERKSSHKNRLSTLRTHMTTTTSVILMGAGEGSRDPEPLSSIKRICAYIKLSKFLKTQANQTRK